MNLFGPVDEAARGGHSNPVFDLAVGFGVLALTWFNYKRKAKPRASFWIALGITAIAGIFICTGIAELCRNRPW